LAQPLSSRRPISAKLYLGAALISPKAYLSEALFREAYIWPQAYLSEALFRKAYICFI